MIPGVTASAKWRRGVAPEPALPTIPGEPFGGGFYAGDIQYPNGQWYKLIIADVASKVTGENSRWKVVNTFTPATGDQVDGMANTQAMIAEDIDLHPAAKHIINHRGGGFADWYMPAKDELNVIYTNLGPNRPNSPPHYKLGGSQFLTSGWFWSSTQYSAENSWMQAMGEGIQTSGIFVSYKNGIILHAIPIRRVPFYPLPHSVSDPSTHHRTGSPP